MADTIREKIIQDLANSLKGGTFTALDGVTVWRGQLLFQEQLETLPVIVVFVADEEAATNEYGGSNCSMTVGLTALIEIFEANPGVLGETVLGELITAAFRAWPEHNDSMHYTGSDINVPEELGQKVLAVGITVTIDYHFNCGDPYTNG
jgi:hypothetical protein